MRRRIEHRLAAAGRVLMILGVLLAVPGCGVKAPPVPPRRIPPPTISNLQAVENAEGVQLIWSLAEADPEAPLAGFLIYRGEVESTAEPCDTCPPSFEQIGHLPGTEAGSGEGRFTYADPVPPGDYRYKVVAYSASGDTGPNSNIAVIRLPVGGPEAVSPE